MNDDDLIRAVKASARRAREARVPPPDARAERAMADAIVASYPPAQARLRARRLVRLGVAAGSIALAASLAFLVRPPSSFDELPRYALVVSGGARDARGGASPTAAPLRLRKGDRFEIDLRPPTAIRGPVEARATLEAPDRRSPAIPFTGAIERASGGAVRIAGTTDDFAGASTGDYELIVVIGRPGAAPAQRQVERVALRIE